MRMTLFGAVVAGLLALPAQAYSARLLAEDAPTTTGASSTVLTPSTTAENTASTPHLSYLPHLGFTFAAAFVTIPAGQALGSLLGSLSNNLLGALIPGVLAMAFIAPTLTTLVAWLVGNWNSGDGLKPFGFLVPWLASVGVHIVALVIAGFAGVTVGLPASLFLFGAIDGLVMSGTIVGTMHLTERKASAESAPIHSFVPGVSDTQLVSLGSVAL